MKNMLFLIQIIIINFLYFMLFFIMLKINILCNLLVCFYGFNIGSIYFYYRNKLEIYAKINKNLKNINYVVY